MASGTTGAGSVTTNTTINGYVDWSSTYNPATNQSTVTAAWYVHKTDSYNTFGYGDFSINIGGVPKAFTWGTSSSSVSVPGSGAYVLVGGASQSATITHDSDGSKSISITVSGAFGSPTTWTSSSGGGTAVLDNGDRRPQAPAAPTISRVEGSTITLTSAAASAATGSPAPPSITDYQYQQSISSSTTGFTPDTLPLPSMGLDQTITLTSMTAGQVYWFRTRAINTENSGVVTGNWSTASIAYAAPTITATSSVGPIASVTVAPPSNNGGSTISSHTVEYSLDSTFATGVSTSTIAGSAGGTATINNLTPGRTWYFRAKYTNAASATSPYSNTTSTFIAAYGRRYQTVTVTGVTAVGSSTTYTTGSAHRFSLNDPVSVTGLTSTYNASGTVTAVTTTSPFSFTLGSTTPTTTSGTVPYTGTGTGAGWALMTTGKRYDANGTSPGVPGWVDVGTAQRYDSTGVWKAFS